MSDLALNGGDLDLTEDNTDLFLTSGQVAIVQHLKQRLQTFLGEWFLDNRIGVPYFEHILKKDYDPVIIDTVLKSEIVNTPGVLELTSFDLDINANTRLLTLTFEAKSTDGVINFSEVIP